MRIGVLTTSFPRQPHDIAGHFVLGLCQALARRGHELEVLAPEPAEGRPTPSFEGVRVHHVPYLRPRRWQRTFYGAGVPDNLRLDARAWLGLAPFTLALWREAARRAAGWDALLSHWALPCGWVAGRIPRRPRHVSVLHSADVHALTRLPGGGRWAAQCSREAEALWFVSAELRDRFARTLPVTARGEALAKSHVCPMGIEPLSGRRRESRAALRERLDVRGLSLLSLGRLVPIKGLDTAIDAVAGTPGVQLVIAGDGPEYERLARRAARLDNIRLVGRVTGADKQDWLRASDAFVLPSRALPGGRTEGAPTALLEAMDAGLPVLASQVGGVPEMLGETPGGVLLPPDDANAWRTAIEALRPAGSRARMGRANRKRAGLFHWDVIAPHAERLLECDDVAVSRAER